MPFGPQAREFAYLGVPMKVPLQDLSKPLEFPEGCWCLFELVRSDVLYRFSADKDTEAYFELLDATKLLCLGRPAPAKDFWAEANVRMYGLGMRIVREALDQARVKNPWLVRRGPPPYGFPERGRPGRSITREAQGILSALGFHPGPFDGGIGPLTRGSLEMFQHVMGLPVTGELDAGTMSLLRNSVFVLSERPAGSMPYGVPEAEAAWRAWSGSPMGSSGR
jgi:hypothetical protein